MTIGSHGRKDVPMSPCIAERGWFRAAALWLTLVCGGCTDDLFTQSITVVGPDAYFFPDIQVLNTDGGSIEFGLSNVSPAHGSYAGENKITINGSGFDAEVTVRVGGVAIAPTATTLVSPVALEVVVPPGEPGVVDIEVVRGSGEVARLPNGYTYDAVVVTPATGPTAGGTLVTIIGKGTAFKSGLELTLGGQPMTDIQIFSETLVRARTPAGNPGPVTLQLDDITVRDAFSYYITGDPNGGGIGGGAIAGSVTVLVVNRNTRQPIKQAVVVLQKGREFELTARTNNQGIAVFTRDEMVGPVTITAGADTFQTATIVQFDARDVTLLLDALTSTNPPDGLPPGVELPIIEGNVLFGGPTGAGSSEWGIVPEPKAGQVKRVEVYATVGSVRNRAPVADDRATITFDPNNPVTAWPYFMLARPGAMAIYAIAGLYHQQSNTFEPYAMGITRGVATTPGARIRVDVVVNIPFTEQVAIELRDIPRVMNRHSVRIGIDLGADGFIVRPDNVSEGKALKTGTFLEGCLP